MLRLTNSPVFTENYPTYGQEEHHELPDTISYTIIPLVLSNYEQALQKDCRRLHFTATHQINIEDVPQTLRLAILIIEGNRQHIKVSHLEDIDYDDIDYEFSYEGSLVKGCHSKDDASVEIMSDEELEKVQALVSRTLSQDTDEPDESETEAASDEKKSGIAFYAPLNFNSSDRIKVLTILANANFCAASRKKQRSEERILDRKARQARDTRKRKEAKREAMWKQRQEHHKRKDGTRERILKTHFRAEIRKCLSVSA